MELIVRLFCCVVLEFNYDPTAVGNIIIAQVNKRIKKM